MENPKDIFELLNESKKDGASKADIYRRVTGFLEQQAREQGIPYHGHFELTPLCNLNCKMCYVHLSEIQMKGKTLLPAKKWIDLMQQAIDAGMVKAGLSGGECLTYPDFDEVFLFLESKGIDISVLTNGILLNRQRIDFFRQHPPRSIQISLYGNSEESYEQVTGCRVFSTVLENIRLAKEAKLPIKIAITPSRFMLETIRDTIRLAKDLEVPYAINVGMMTPRSDTGRNKTDNDITLDEYIDIFCYNRKLNGETLKLQKVVPFKAGMDTEYKNTGLKCGAGRSSFSILWDGKMSPCTLMDSISADPIQNGFADSWDYINREVNCFPRFEKCDNCAYSGACSFCAAENEKQGSRYCLSPLWCKQTWKMVENGLRQVEPFCEEV